MWTDHARLAVARRWLASGASLNEAAMAAGVNAGELDLMLWRSIGEKPEKPAPRSMPQMRRGGMRLSRDEAFAQRVLEGARECGLLT